ncbi:hypothetical protein LCGC14_1290790, partial [marine sediment metagenome]
MNHFNVGESWALVVAAVAAVA